MIDDRDVALRNETYRRFVELGHAPQPDELGDATRCLRAGAASTTRTRSSSTGRAIRMANPFSAVPTPYRVEADGRSWFANCAWDAFGICAALHADGWIETACPDCGDPIRVEVRDRQPDDASLLFHCLVPAARWWDDIVFT